MIKDLDFNSKEPLVGDRRGGLIPPDYRLANAILRSIFYKNQLII
jgi:hypothetical protein